MENNLVPIINYSEKNDNKEKCTHEKEFCCFCTDKNYKNKNSTIYYECYYNYHLSHINKCIP